MVVEAGGPALPVAAHRDLLGREAEGAAQVPTEGDESGCLARREDEGRGSRPHAVEERDERFVAGACGQGVDADVAAAGGLGDVFTDPGAVVGR